MPTIDYLNKCEKFTESKNTLITYIHRILFCNDFLNWKKNVFSLIIKHKKNQDLN